MINDFKVLQVYDVDLGYLFEDDIQYMCTVRRICAMTPAKDVCILYVYI